MHPEIHINYLAILAAMVAYIVLGFLWYGPIFGNAWKNEMRFPDNFKPQPQAMARAIILMIVGCFLTTYVLAHSVQVWRPSVWKVGPDASNATYGFFAGFFTWIGFYVPVLFGSVSWENKSWKLFWINAGYYFVALQLTGMILAYWR